MAVRLNCPRKNQPGSWVSPQAAAKRRRPQVLTPTQGQRPCSSTISLEASRRRRHSSRRLCRKRDGGSRFVWIEDSERTLLAAGEEREWGFDLRCLDHLTAALTPAFMCGLASSPCESCHGRTRTSCPRPGLR